MHHALIGDFNRVGHDQLLILFSAGKTCMPFINSYVLPNWNYLPNETIHSWKRYQKRCFQFKINCLLAFKMIFLHFLFQLSILKMLNLCWLTFFAVKRYDSLILMYIIHCKFVNFSLFLMRQLSSSYYMSISSLCFSCILLLSVHV